MDQLTKRQAEVLFLIQEFVRDNSYPPTVRDLVALTGRKNTAGVQKIHDALREKGYIKKTPGYSRGIVPLGGGQSVWVPVVGWVQPEGRSSLRRTSRDIAPWMAPWCLKELFSSVSEGIEWFVTIYRTET